jgi:hypothetical protein
MAVNIKQLLGAFGIVPPTARVDVGSFEERWLAPLQCVGPAEAGDDYQVILVLHSEKPLGCRCSNLTWKDVLEVCKTLPPETEVHIARGGMSFGVHGVLTNRPPLIASRIVLSASNIPTVGPRPTEENPIVEGTIDKPEDN